VRLSELKIGEEAFIDRIEDVELSHLLYDLGCFPGESIKKEGVAPLGDPILIEIAGTRVSLRKKDASSIFVMKK